MFMLASSLHSLHSKHRYIYKLTYTKFLIVKSGSTGDMLECSTNMSGVPFGMDRLVRVNGMQQYC